MNITHIRSQSLHYICHLIHSTFEILAERCNFFFVPAKIPQLCSILGMTPLASKERLHRSWNETFVGSPRLDRE